MRSQQKLSKPRYSKNLYERLLTPLSVVIVMAIACLILLTSQASSLAQPAQPAITSEAIQLPPLPYDYAALAPYIDEETMQLHHDKHHATYVTKLNEALAQLPNPQTQDLTALLKDLDSVPEAVRKTIQNNGGGHLNHSMFWQIMAPNQGGVPTGAIPLEGSAIATAIETTFGSFDSFKQQFEEAGTKQFGSGWAWLVLSPENELQIITTANQDSPFMQGLYPILGNDLWEHAYYLNYRNRRAEYLGQWWNVVNWEEVNSRFSQAEDYFQT
jgi:superoxide dismutase, Fe-Mn family